MSSFGIQHGMGMEESYLLNRLAEGDKDAFDSIYGKYFGSIYRNACMLTKDEAESEDIVQEVFLQLWNHRSSMSGRESAGGWLFITCHNLCKNILRRRMREALAMKEIHATEEEDVSTAMHDNKANLLERGLSRLSWRQRQTFNLCKVEGRSHEEAAKIMNISRHTVKEYLSIAMNSIRRFAQENAERMSLFQVILSALYQDQ
jgi:RNA polymerase sigma factor (sigma-70 family)